MRCLNALDRKTVSTLAGVARKGAFRHTNRARMCSTTFPLGRYIAGDVLMSVTPRALLPPIYRPRQHYTTRAAKDVIEVVRHPPFGN